DVRPPPFGEPHRLERRFDVPRVAEVVAVDVHGVRSPSSFPASMNAAITRRGVRSKDPILSSRLVMLALRWPFHVLSAPGFTSFGAYALVTFSHQASACRSSSRRPSWSSR